jgi:transcriptional regulator with XRE-family HTH domain
MAGSTADSPTPLPVRRALRATGSNLSGWRRLQALSAQQVADRAGIGVATLHRIERGDGASFENILRVARALGVLDRVIAAFDPSETAVGRMRALESLPKRIRGRGSDSS